MESIKKSKFPKDIRSAYEHVLHNELTDKDFIYAYIDKCCDIDGPEEPFYRRPDKFNPSKVNYIRRKAHKHTKMEDIDPLTRFQFEICSTEVVLFQSWILKTEGQAAADGLFFEAAIACHALQHESCYNCKCRQTLRWNGGSGSAWQDLICTMCKSTFEVKTKANMMKVESNFDYYRSIPGGSFTEWCRLINNGERNQKKFLVMMPRTPALNRQLQKIHPVQIAEIDYVLPRIQPRTFNPNYSHVRLSTHVFLKKRAKWFDLPSPGEKIDRDDIAKEVFIKRFQKDCYDSLYNLYFGNSNEESKAPRTEYAGKSSEEKTAANSGGLRVEAEETVIEQFRALEVAPDDWEDLLSDSD